MRNLEMNACPSGAQETTAQVNSLAMKAISLAGQVFLAAAILSISGCIGLTGVSKTNSGQPGASGAATISVEPGTVSFGHVPVGGTASQSVTISNGGGSNLTVTQATTTAAGVKITGITLPLLIGAGKQSTFDVVFSPKAAGTLSGDVSVMSDISSSPSMVSLSGLGMAATAVLTTNTSSLGFGNVAVGRSSALSVTLTNAGNSSVTVSRVTVSGARYSESGVSAGLILAPGQSATLDATFAPLAAGSQTGSVTLTSNATNSPMTISFTGDGTQTGPPTAAHEVQLTWTPSTSAVAGYNVYRSEVSGGPYTKLDSIMVVTDSYTDTNVQAGQTYYYVVTSATAAGVQSLDSAQASATVPAP